MIKLGLLFLTAVIAICLVYVGNVSLNDYDYINYNTTKTITISPINTNNNKRLTKEFSLPHIDEVSIEKRIDTKFINLTVEELKVEETSISQLIIDEDVINRLNTVSYSSEERLEIKNLLIHLGKVRTRMIDLSIIQLKNKVDHYKNNRSNPK